MGISETVYSTPQNEDSSSAQAYVTGLLDTATYNIFTVRYVSNTLDPKIAAPGDTLDFSAYYSNPGIDTVFLDTTNTIFSFTDGTYTASSNLSNPLFLEPRTDSTQLFFNNTDIDPDFLTGNFTPEVDFFASSGGQNISGTQNMDPGELSMAPLEILSIAITNPATKIVIQGDTLRVIQMIVRNNSLNLINNLTPALSFAPPLASTPIADPANADSVPGNSQVTLLMAAPIPSDATLGSYIIDGSVSGNLVVNGNPVFDIGANLTDNFDIISGANVSFVTYTPQTVSTSQNVAYEVTVSNSGIANVVLNQTQTIFEFGGQNFTLNGDQIISADTSSVLRFASSTVGLTSGRYSGTLSLVGTQNGVPYSDTLFTGATDSLTVEDPAVLEIVSIINPPSVLRSQENILDTLIIRNSGVGTARVTSASLNFQNGNNFYSQQVNSPSFPLDLAGGVSDTIEFLVNVSSSAPLGVDSLAGTIQGFDLNSSANLDTTSDYLSSWQVFDTGGISLLSVSTSLDTVSTGQDSVLVTARVENTGSNSVVIDSLQLLMTRGTYVDSTLYLTPGSVLASGTRSIFNFYVSVDSNSATGIETINASVFATDSVTGPLSDLSADTTASWLIQNRVTLAIASASPTAASIGQVISPTVDLSNSGTADLIVDTSLTVLQSSAFGTDLTLTAPVTIAGGGSYTLNFNSGTADGASGIHPYSLRLVGTENGSLFDNTYILSDSLTLTAPAQLVIDSLIASTDTVSQGMDTLITVYVSNPGETDLILDSLINTPYGQPSSITPILPTTISGGSSAAYDLVVDIPTAAATGLIALDAIGLGRDANSNQTLFDSSATVTDNWIVLSSPNVVIDSIFSDSIIVPGQTDIPVTVVISNSGDTDVEINTLDILRQIGLYTFRGPDLPVTLPGGTTINLVDTVDVASNSATGIDTLRARITYRNTVSGDTDILTSTETWAWSIQSSSDLVLLSVVAAESNISLGQDSVNVDVRVRNQGAGTATVDTLTLEFASGDTNYTVSGPIPMLSLSLIPDADTTFSFMVNVNPTALTGPDIINARMVGTEIASGTPIEVNGALTADSWTVQDRPLVVMDSVTVTPSIASTGQTGLSGRIIITNQTATYRASAQIDSVDLNFLLGIDNVDTNFSLTRITPPTLPIILPAGASQAVDFRIDVNNNALDTTFTADGFLSYIDINDGNRTDVTSANQPGSLTVQSTSTLNITSLTVIPDTVSNGQSGISGTMIFENTGSAQVTITEAQLSFTPPADFISILSGRTTPFSVPGNTIDTLNFAVTAATSLTGDVSVDGILRGTDNNSQTTTSDTSQTSIFIQSEAAPAWAGLTEPSSAELDSAVVFKVTIVNTGESSIQIDTTQTTLVLESSPSLIFTLSDTSDLNVAGNGDTTILVFKELVITGISADDYSLTLNLTGNSNSSPYTSTLNVGTITVGGQIFFGPAQVSPNQVLQGQRNLTAVMQVGNNGVPLSIDSLGTTLIFRDQLSNVLFVDSLTRTDTLTVLRSITDNELTFTFNIPADFEVGDINVYGKISLDNNSIERESLNPITSFTVSSGANIVYVDSSLTPMQAVPNEDVLFAVALYDSGTADLALIPDSTYLQIGFMPTLRTNLGGNYNLSAGEATAVTFESLQIPGSVSNGTYSLSIHTVGTTFGRDTLIQDILLTDSLTILTSGTLVLSSIQLSDTAVSQGSSDETLSLNVVNSGEAPASIFSADSIQFNYNSTYSLSLNSGQVFPLTINAGDSAVFVYDIFVDPSAIAGQDTFRARIGYEDVSSSVSYTASDPGVYDNWRVLSNVSLNIVALTATDTRVTQGQNGLAVSMEISNTGESAAVIGSADSVGITFFANNNTVTLISPAVPDTILSATSQTFNFTVDINPSAATGLDSLAGFVIGRNVNTGSVSSVSSGYLDGWDVQTPANLIITRVFSNLSQVNSGQQNLSVEVRLRNIGQATALLDTVGIFSLPDSSSIIDTLIAGSMADSLIAGARDTVYFNVDVASGFTGIIELDAFNGYRDGNDILRTSTNSGADNTHIWTVGTEGILVVDSVFTPTATMSLGQSDVAVRASIRNTGNSSVQIDSLNMLYNGSDTHPVLSSVRVLPATLPLLSTGQSFIAEFNLSSASLPLDSGLVELDLAAFGTDDITGSLIDTLNSEQPDTVLLQTPAVLEVVSIINPATVLRGEENVLDTLVIRNNGNATARITSATFNFLNGNNFYTQQVNSPSMPFDLAGGVTDTIEVSVNILTNAPLGIDSLAGAIQGIELNRNVVVGSTSEYITSWQVTGESSISILSVSTDRTLVSQGEDSLDVQARLLNQGTGTMTIDSLELQFSNGNGNYIISGPVPAPGFTLAAGRDTTMSFLVDVNGTATTGPDTIDARLVATEGTETFIIDGAINTDIWTVQNRPVVVIDSVTISPSVASTGQSGLSGRMVITNQTGTFRSSARIDSLDYNFLLGLDNVDTNFVINQITPPVLPFTLPAGASQAVNFNIGINSNALDTTYVADGTLSYVDINDDTRFTVSSANQQDTLLIQSTTTINILSLTVIPDTVSQGQNNVAGQLIYENAGSAELMVTTAQLSFNPAAGFISNLVGRTTPYTVAGNTHDTLNYSITTPTTLTGDVLVDGIVSGIDLNSTLITGDSAQTSIYLQTPATAEWAGTTFPSIFDVDDTVSFEVNVVNTGEATLILDSTLTSLNLLTTPFGAIELSGTSPIRIAGGDTVTLIFTETIISGISPGDYAVQISLNGISTGMAYNQTLNTGQVTIGGQVFFTGGSVVPDVVLQGQPNITVNMIVGNDGSDLSIDSIGTYVDFRQSGVLISPQPAIVRTDALDTLYHSPTNQLSYVLDIPADFPLGDIEVYGNISLDGGSLVKQSITSIATFQVFGGAELFYVSGSVSESQVVPRQEIAFNITVADSGTSGLTLVPNLSYLEIDSSPVLQAGLAANYIIPAGDSSRISFNQITIPESMVIDTSYTFVARLVGVQANGDTLTDTLTLEPLTVLARAAITIANIEIVPNVVRQNQSDVEIQYNLRNDGSSDARVLSLVPHFSRTQDSRDVTSDWVLSSISPEFPTTIIPGDSQLYNAYYVLSAQADTGMIVAEPNVYYNDIRTTDFIDTSYTLVNFDSVRVIQPAALRIDRLVMSDSLAPNNPRVNINETFILHLAVSNLGADNANSVNLSLLENGIPVGQYVIPTIAPYDSQFVDISRSVAVANPYSFVARIDSAFDATTGERVNIAQPIDNREDIIADTPVLLNISSAIARPGGALDSVVSVGQQFDIDATALNAGSAPYDPGRVRLTVPLNYTLLTQADSTYSESDPVITWQIQANDTTVSGYDTVFVTLIDTSLDRNTGRTAGLGEFTDYILVRTESKGNFTIDPFIAGPAGAQDDTLSTGQVFTLTADIGFPNNVEDSSRVAQLLLPGGYSVVDSTIKPLPNTVPNTSISWEVIARNNVINKLDSIRVRVIGVDGNSGQTVQGTSDPLTVITVTRAELTLSAAITSPAGATDGRVSVGQDFDLSAVIANRGTAGIMPGDTTGQVSIQLPANLSLISGNDTQPYVFGQPVVWGINVLAEFNPSEIVVRIESTPHDENSEMPASTVTDSVIVTITIEETGTIAISGVTPEDNTVSSGQTFVISTVYELSPNVTEATASISSLPVGFKASPNTQGLANEDTLRWNIVAAENISQITDYTIDFTASGLDRNSSTPIQGGNTTVAVTVQPKAQVQLNAEILSPASALTKNTVSRGQLFEIRTMVSRDFTNILAMADIAGSTEITAFYNPLFELEGDSIKTVTQWSDSITWRFRAPDTVINASNFSFSITQAPLDANSGLSASIAGDKGAKSFALSVTQENLVITNITDPVLDTLGIDDNNFLEGSENVPLMVFTAEYPGSASDTATIKMDGVRLKFLEPISDQEMDPNRIINLIESITISNMQWFVDSVAADFAKPARRFTTYMIPDTMENPIDIRWNPPNAFLADSTDTVVVMVSFRDGTQHQSFRLALDNVYAYDVDPDLNLTAVDEDLTPLPESTKLTTDIISSIPGNPEDAFITYPNPFGKNQDYANIKFYLDTGGDVEIRIFTLVGELVWTKVVQGETAGSHDGASDSQYRWDGKNDKGYTVLNGVYLCVLRVKEQGGGTKTYTKKIAYIK